MATCSVTKDRRSAQGIRARPDRMKQSASPRIPVEDPMNAIGPKMKRMFSLASMKSWRDVRASSFKDGL